MKLCSTCKIEKDSKEFTKDSKKKDGLKINCVDCCKVHYENYRKKNYEKEKKRVREYNKNRRIIVFDTKTKPSIKRVIY